MLRLFFVLFVSLFFVNPVLALEISPAKNLLVLDRGENINSSLEIFNDSNREKKYKIEVLGFFQNEEGLPVFGKNFSEAEEWIKIDNKEFVLSSGQNYNFLYEINIPKDAYPGSYYLGLAVLEQENKESGLSVKSQLISLLTLQVSGMVKEELVIENFTKERSYFWDKKQKVNLGIKNKGDVEISTQSKIELKNFFSDEVLEEKDIYLGNNILSQSKRNLEFEILPKKIKSIGLYKIKIDIVYGRTNQNISEELVFFYLSPIFLYFIPIFLLVILFLKRMKNEKK